MAAAQCEISFKIDYTSSVPVTSANSTASYEIIGSGYPNNSININPDNVIILPVVQTPGDYDLKVKLTVEGVDAISTESFKIGNCKDDELRTIFYNHAKNLSGGDDLGTEVDFLIKKNGERVVFSNSPNTDYDGPIDRWRSFEAKVGDRIEFSTDLLKSGSYGKTTGSMFTCSTTGVNGTVNGVNPTALDFKSLNSQDIGSNSITKRIFAFEVESKVNYALGTDFFQ